MTHTTKHTPLFKEMLEMLKTARAYIETPGDLNDGEVRCLIEDLNYTIEQAEGGNHEYE